MDELDLSILFNKYNEAFVSIKDRFDLLYKEFSVLGENNPIEHIKYRIKKQDSIMKKLMKLDMPFNAYNIENRVNDVIGIRIVCSFLDDLEFIKNVLIEMSKAGEFEIINKKDYISTPKESGYSSYHMIVRIPVKIRNEIYKVKAEIQIRTIAMDVSASLEHKLRYKKDFDNSLYDASLEKTTNICRRIDGELNDFIRENKVERDDTLFERYSFIRDNQYKILKLKYEAALGIIRNKINNIYVMYEKSGDVNPIEHIKYRIKDEQQILRKLLLEGKSINLENIEAYVNDFAGIRVVCSFINDLKDIVRLIKEDKDLEIVREKDYVNNPKESGYRGYHLTVLVPVYLSSGMSKVKVEIQLRTIAMEMWASLEQKICYHKETTDEARSELKRLSGVIEIVDNNINDMVGNSKESKNVKVKSLIKEES